MPAIEFVLDHPREGLDEVHLVTRDLQGAGGERGAHTGEAQPTKRSFQFCNRHRHWGSPVWASAECCSQKVWYSVMARMPGPAWVSDGSGTRRTTARRSNAPRTAA